MKTTSRAALLALLTLTAAAQAQPAGPPPPKITAKLLAANASIAPGGSTELIIEIGITKGWHIYHPVILGTGFATSIRFTGPPGVTIDPVRYETPHLAEQFGFEYLSFEDSLMCLTTVRVAPGIPPGKSIQLTAEIRALACIEECVPVSTSATLSLPVTAEMGATTNAEKLKEAREGLAAELKNAEFIAGSEVTISKPSLKPGEEAEIVATIRVKEHHHIMDRDPGLEGLVPSRLFIEKVNGIEIAEEKDQVWPSAKSREMPGLGTVREQSGEFRIRVPIKLADPEFPSGDVRLRVLFQYQCCTDEGQCFAPAMAAGSVTFRADTPTPPDPEKATYVESPSAWTDGGGSAPPAASRPVAAASAISAWYIAIPFAFLGGLILNVMPCVLPVISIKILSFVKQAGEDRVRILNLGLAFCAGIMVWFWIFAAISIAGHVPLQHPWVVISVATVLLVLALNMFGVFEIILPGSTMTSLDAVSAREGYGGAFLKGFLATLLGTACTAPFLAGALVYATTQPPLLAFAVFTAAGVGMASPYLLLCAKPGWLKYMPRPGTWMVNFKEAMGFILLGTNIWMLKILFDLTDGDMVVWTVGFWCFVGFACWWIGKIGHSWSFNAHVATWAAALALCAGGYLFSYELMYDPPEHVETSVDLDTLADLAIEHVNARGWDEEIPWFPYQKGLAQKLAERGYTVYVDYTATWCANCKWNNSTVLETDDIRAKMRAARIIPIEADFTKEAPEMRDEIRSFGRSSVPLNLVYPAGKPNDPIVLPVLLTNGYVTDALAAAGPSSAGAPPAPKTASAAP